MRSLGIRFIQFRERVTMPIALPANLLEITQQMAATGADLQPALLRITAQQSIHAVDPILHRWVRGSHPHRRRQYAPLAPQEISDDLPVGAGARRAPVRPTGIPVNFHCERWWKALASVPFPRFA